MMVKRLRIGVLGTANIAHRSVIPAIKSLPELFELRGIASRNFDRAKEMGERFGCEAFESYDSVLESGALDAIYIPLPNSMHFEFVKKALANNLHVLVEKSLGINLAEVSELKELAKTRRLALVENFQFRFHRQLKIILDLLQEGRVGELRSIRTSFGMPPFPDPKNIRYQKSLAGGALLDAGAYPIKLSQIILGENLTVKAANLNYEGKEVDIWGGGYLQQVSGPAFSEIAFGFDNFYQCGVEVWGSKGKLTTDRIFTARSDFRPEIVLETNEGRSLINVEPDDHFKNMLQHFHSVSGNTAMLAREYEQNVNQSRLLQEFKEVAHES